MIRAVGVETGGSNVQFAVNPATDEIVVIEMNPRVSRSSRAGVARRPASRSPRSPPGSRSATRSTRSRTTSRAPRPRASSRRSTTSSSSGRGSRSRSSRASTPTLSTHMKSVGEVMAIGRTFGQAFGKALRSRELDAQPSLEGSDEELLTRLETPERGPLRRPARTAAARRLRRRDPRPHGHRSVVPARAAQPRPRVRRRPHLQGRRHLRGRVRGRDAVLLLRLGADAAPVRGPPRRPAERDDPRLRPEPDRPGHRVRLLLRARGDDRARVRPRRGDGQLQPGDGLDRLRHVRPAVLRAADARGRAGDRRGRAARGRDRVLRRPDAAAARRGPGGGRRDAARHAARGDRPRRGPRPLRRAARAARAARRRRTRSRRRPRRRSRPARASASRCSCARRYVLGGRAMELAYDEEMLADYFARTQAAGRDLPRPLPRERDRGRRRRDLRRRGRLDRRDHAARRGGRHPLRRLRLRAAAALARRRDAGRDPRRPRATSRSRSASSA